MTTPITQSLRLFAIALLAMATILSLSLAANAAKGAKVPTYHGHVIAVDAAAGTITIERKKQTPMTFSVTSSTRVFLEKAPSTLTNIQVGYACHIKSADGKTALVVRAHPKVPHVKNPKGAALPATL